MDSCDKLIDYINNICSTKNIKPENIFFEGYEGEDIGVSLYWIDKEKNIREYVGFVSSTQFHE